MPHVNTPQSRLLCGLARCDITPEIGMYHRTWGAAVQDRSTGVHRPLTATAMVLRAHEQQPSPTPDGAQELALVCVDHCLLGGREMARLLADIEAGSGLPAAQVLVLFSHTHAAGLLGLDRSQLPGGELIEPYLAELGHKLAALVRQSRGQIQPATITYGWGRSSLAANRDLRDQANQLWVCGYNPDGPADDTLLVARITGPQGELLGTLVNYACHPTTLAWQNSLISPDFPGAMREVIETATGAPALFVQGASGDLGPRQGFVGDTRVADANGRQLGYAALSALEGLPPPGTRYEYAGPVISGATIGAWNHVPLGQVEELQKQHWRHLRWTVDVPLREGLATTGELDAQRRRLLSQEQEASARGDTLAARDYRAQVEIRTRQLGRLSNIPAGKTYPFPIELLKVGDAVWVAVEAEHYQVLQTRLRARFPGLAMVVATIVNGSRPTYLPTRETYGTGIYQETIALLAAGSLERLIESIGGQISEWLAQPAPSPEHS